MPERSDRQLWADYKNAGGELNYTKWIEGGKPGVPTERGFRFPWQTVAGEGFIAPWTEQVTRPTQEGLRFAQPVRPEQRQAEGVLQQVGGLGPEIPPTEEEPAGLKPPGFTTFAAASRGLPNENWEVYKNEFGRFDIRRKQAPAPIPEGLTPAQQAEQEFSQQQFQFQQQQWAQQQAQQQAQWEWEQQQAGMVSPYQQQQFGLQEQQLSQQQQQQRAQLGFQEEQLAQGQQQFQEQLAFQQAQMQAAQEEQERQYRSQLAAQPINWLQYAAYTGEEPVVQPWMVPLGFQDTGGAITPQGQNLPALSPDRQRTGTRGIAPQVLQAGGLQPGQPIPGWSPTGMTGMPQLRTPSAQLQARWGPTAQAQYLGYRQARTGAAPEESQFRLGSGRAPTGAHRGFSGFR